MSTLYQQLSQVLCQSILLIKKVRSKAGCYILHVFLLETILLFIIAITYYYCTKHRSKHIGELLIFK